MTTPLPTDPDERLALLAEKLECDPRERDVVELAARFDLPRELVEDAVVAARAFDEAFGEDLPPDLAPPIPLPPGHELVSELGRGGMGVVYRVHHRALGRDVALKALRLAGPDAPTAARFEREVRALARLRHPHIVRVFEGGEVDGAMYYTMEYIAGSTLADLIPTGIGVARSVRLLTRIADAVEHAHQHGVVHRDLKPSNILIDEAGEPFVVDFGLARDAGFPTGAEQNTPTLTGQVVGTPAYMSPEQAAGVPAGEAADIYALGTILYECLTEKRPFTDSPVPELLWRVMHEEPERPGNIVPAIPRALETICQHAMRKDPSRRYPSAQAFCADLERFADGRPIQAQPPSAFERARLWLQRRASHLLTAALAILVASLVTHAIFGGPTPEEIATARLAEAEQLAARGDHGAARTAYYDAMVHHQAEHEEGRAAYAWLAMTANRVAELRRLGRPDRARPLLAECLAEEPRISRLLAGRVHSYSRAELCFHWLRVRALVELTPSLRFDSDILGWHDIARVSDPELGMQLLMRSLDTAPGADRDASLALLLTLLHGDGRPREEWDGRPLGLVERWLIDALRRFDPDCPLQQTGNDLADVQRYAASAMPPFTGAVATLAHVMQQQYESGERRDYATDWQPLRAHLAIIARHDLGDVQVLWEETREFTGPTDWRIERADTLPGPVGGSPIATDTRLGLNLSMLEVEAGGWSGRVIHAHLVKADLTLALPEFTGSTRTESNVFLQPGTTVSLGAMAAPWLLTAGHTTSLSVLLSIEDAGNPASTGDLTGWRARVRSSLRAARETGRRPVVDSELWTRLDPVFDLAITDARDDAVWLLANAPEHAPVEPVQHWLEFARVALGASGLQKGQFRARRPDRHPTVDCAWIAVTCDNTAIRAAMLGLIQSPQHARRLPTASQWDLRTAAAREHWRLPATIAAVVEDARDPADPTILARFRSWFDGPWRSAVIFSMLGGVLLLELGRWRRRSPNVRSNQAASFVMAAGVFVWFACIGRNALPLPLWLGPVLALLGAVWWSAALPADSPPQARRARRNVAACFATAVFVSLLDTANGIFTLVPMLLAIALRVLHAHGNPKRRFEQARKRIARKPPIAT